MISVTEQNIREADNLNLAGVGVEEAVSRLIEHAASLPASDLFLTWNESDVTVSVRHLGVLRHLVHLAPETGRHFINCIKAAVGMDVAQKFHPLDGRWIRQLIFEGRSTREIHEKAVHEGMLDLRQAGLLKVAQGITSLEELVRIIPGDQFLLDAAREQLPPDESKASETGMTQKHHSAGPVS